MSTTSQRKRAKYLTSSSPLPKPEPPKADPGFSFCESVYAVSNGPWHLRRLDDSGRKLGGGITTNSLCGLVTRGWDLNVDITEHHLKHSCKRCVAEYLKLKLKPE